MIRNNKHQEIQQHEVFTLKSLDHKSNKKLLFLNRFQLKFFNLSPGDNVFLQVGTKKLSVEVAIQGVDSSITTLYITKDILKHLSFYQKEPLLLVFNTNRIIILGPTIGLTITKKTWDNIEKSDVVKKRARLALDKGILFYCIRVNSINWVDNLVEAYSLNPINNMWVKKIIAIPQVIHDRGSSPGPDTVKSYTHRGKAGNIYWINTTRTFGKWETYQVLSSISETNKYLPETTLFTIEKLEEYLKKYKYCYVKDNYGRSGRKVFRVERLGDNYLCKTGGSKVKTWQLIDLENLAHFLYKTIGENLILQQRIFLAQIDGSPFDMRVLVQKNKNNNWVITALNYRIAKPGAIVTNFAAGAKDVFTMPGEALLHSSLSWNRLEEIALRTVNAMELSFGSLGEVGLDVALDMKGKLWLIEANSRPSSIAYREASTEACKLIFGLPLDYAIYLVRKNFI
ncbi:YheC/YheD family endospore coat-associated protein [Alkaliphilus peptidifermentans]|uniref:YheC/D like ATP-grasp n=1 Tax=Alkaliphilus peptidifermentans DSM 18978 TaxID=1120976 RepID=A0A1G5H196_9FIRM|nr:YheC/YheD family protein [Alkaliphilus peptidifermentans]SCY57329.1 YheC/D like ATP-grasp [Alkaliphilus peptidifermentans DSM 18978]